MKTAAEILKERVRGYNATVNDISKFMLVSREIKLFTEAMESYHAQFTPSISKDDIEEAADTKSWIEWIERRVPLDEMQKQYVGFAIAELIRLASKTGGADGWVKVEDGLPEVEETVIIALGSNIDGVGVAWMIHRENGDRIWCDAFADGLQGITHWQPLPTPPSVAPSETPRS